MNMEDKEIFIARMKGLMDDDAIINEIKKLKIRIAHYVKTENWLEVMNISEQLHLYTEEYKLREEEYKQLREKEIAKT